MLSLLIEANLNEAKYLWKRCPYSLKTNADGLYGKLWGVGQIMWKGDIAMAVMESAKLAAQFQNHILSEHLLSLKAATFISLLRTLTTLYTKVTAATVAGMIGITSEEELASELAKVNWSIDATTGLVKSNDPQVLTLAEEKVFSNLEYSKFGIFVASTVVSPSSCFLCRLSYHGENGSICSIFTTAKLESGFKQ